MTNFKTQMSLIMPSFSDIQCVQEMHCDEHPNFLKILGTFMSDIQERADIVCEYTFNHQVLINEVIAVFMQLSFPDLTDKQKAQLRNKAIKTFNSSIKKTKTSSATLSGEKL